MRPGGEGFGRVLLAGSPTLGAGHLLAALEVAHDDGPWVHADGFRKVNAVLRYSRGTSVNGLSVTAMGYHGQWNSTDQVPRRALLDSRVDRFDAIDPTDGGHSYRDSVAVDWQRSRNDVSTHITAYGLGYDLDLFSNFTYYLHDQEHGDQIEQTDHRFVAGASVSHLRMSRWHGHLVQNTFGVELRADHIAGVGLYHTRSRARLAMVSRAAALENTGGVFELVFSGDEGTTEAGAPGLRRGVEVANYFRATKWLVLDGDVSWSRAGEPDRSVLARCRAHRSSCTGPRGRGLGPKDGLGTEHQEPGTATPQHYFPPLGDCAAVRAVPL